MLQVVEVVLNPLANRSITPPATDLSPSGNARFQSKPLRIARNFVAKNFNEVRPFRSRPDKAHLSA
jgi:hypothetical protein